MAARGLRLAAIAIALAGAVDPALTRRLPLERPLALVVIDDGSLDLPVANGVSARARALAAAADLRARLADEYAVTIRTHEAHGAAAACPGEGGCLVLSTGAAPARLTAGAEVIGGIRLDPADAPNVAIAAVSAPGAHLHGRARLTVQLRGQRVSGTSHLQLLDGDVPVGAASYQWPGAAADDPHAAAEIALDWLPMAAGLRRLRLQVLPLEGEASAADVADLAIPVSDTPLPVLVYETEASWAGTFVRRALSSDPRLDVRARTRLAPDVAVTGSRAGPMTAAELSDVRVVIVAGPHRLTAAEVDLLDRFVRVRGGSVALLLSSESVGSAARLLPPVRGTRVEPEPATLGSLRATELLFFDAAAAGTRVIASRDDRPVVVSRATGDGLIVASGALDAWRYRDDGGFAGFWQSVAAAVADSAGPPLRLTLSRALVMPGEQVDVMLEWRAIDPLPVRMSAGAAARCGDETEVPIRLWPAGRPGTFAGTIRVDTPARCEIGAWVAEPRLTTSATLLVTPDVRRPRDRQAAIDGAVTAHGGVVMPASDAPRLADLVRRQLPTSLAPQETRPMRSLWWLVPFTACLGVEWWLRRRAGLR